MLLGCTGSSFPHRSPNIDRFSPWKYLNLSFLVGRNEHTCEDAYSHGLYIGSREMVTNRRCYVSHFHSLPPCFTSHLPQLTYPSPCLHWKSQKWNKKWITWVRTCLKQRCVLPNVGRSFSSWTALTEAISVMTSKVMLPSGATQKLSNLKQKKGLSLMLSL